MILLAAAVLMVAAAVWASPSIVFDTEIIHLEIRGDTLRVEGIYRFLASPDLPHISLFYPYPEDSLLGRAWTETLAWRSAGDSAWIPLRIKEREDGRGCQWRIFPEGCKRPEVRTVYRQLLKANYARYIVTTTSVWSRPLRQARFELALPEDTELIRSTFPFERSETGIYVFEAERFMPEVDVIVEWAKQ